MHIWQKSGGQNGVGPPRDLARLRVFFNCKTAKLLESENKDTNSEFKFTMCIVSTNVVPAKY